MSPWERYQSDMQRQGFTADPAQRVAVDYTQQLYDDLVSEYKKSDGFFSRLSKSVRNRKNSLRGLYIWGGVGRGKTHIVDAFYEALPFQEKKRIHFHRFMQLIHHELKHIRDVENPLVLVAENFAKDTQVLCFDEFHVTDITDAMLLGGLLKALFERGITLVATSNEEPDRLYWEGLQRERFLPAIELIKEYTQVVHIESGVDYRLRYLDKAEIYHVPHDDYAVSLLVENFSNIAPDAGEADVILEISGRPIQTIRCADGVTWLTFSELCDGPRGPADYIEIARQFQTVLISDIPQLDENSNDQAKRFMTLVDEFYDRQVKLILTAAAPPEALYTGKRLAKTFTRTISRLQEMQTHDYLAKQHLS